jgi:hypothetical protein
MNKGQGWLKIFFISPPFLNLNSSSPRSIAKCAWFYMQFADFAGKFACGAQFALLMERIAATVLFENLANCLMENRMKFLPKFIKFACGAPLLFGNLRKGLK